MSLEVLMPFAEFGMSAAGAWLALEQTAGNKSRAAERLDELKNPSMRKAQERAGGGRKSDAMSKVLEHASPSKPLQLKNEYGASKLRANLANSGFRSEVAASVVRT